MPKKTTAIPINLMATEFGEGISVERLSIPDTTAIDKANSDSIAIATEAHRHDSHSFFLLESGCITVEIDFETYIITAPSVIYIHPDQVNRTVTSENLIVSSWAITDENLNPEYLKLLRDLTPAKPLSLSAETFSIMTEAVSLCLKFAERKGDKLHHPLLKDGCNALVAFVISRYLEFAKSTDKLSRLEVITKAFRDLLEHNYITLKSPAAYAERLNISTPYLNECVKNTTGYTVSYHIQQRIILEAKRLLYHSDRSVKEIAAMLGYDDYPYFSRLFAKVAGITALAFRNKNFD